MASPSLAAASVAEATTTLATLATLVPMPLRLLALDKPGRPNVTTPTLLHSHNNHIANIMV